MPPLGRIEDPSNPHAKGLRPYDVHYSDADWETVHLPHTVREEALMCSGGRNYQGICWYRKVFKVENSWKNCDLLFELEGAMQRVDAWLDGKPLATKLGGFLPVAFDMTGLSAGEHLLVLMLDNTDMKDVPPGKPQGALDFCYFGGLYRNAWFHIAEKVRFTSAVHEGKPASGGLYVRYPEVTKERAVVRVTANWLNHSNKGARTKLRLLLDGKPVYESGEIPVKAGGEADHTCEFTVESPRLWHPAHPALYTLTAELYRGGKCTDVYTDRIGIRKTEFRADGFYLNGEKFFLHGANRHQEYAYIGFALPDSLQRRDLRLLKEAGINVIRTAHYPPDTTFVSACDELGIFCVIPTPGWQIHPDSVIFDRATEENTRRMIRWHRNHPSALLWEPILNETDYPAYFAQNQLHAVKEECGDADAWCGCDHYAPLASEYPVIYQTGSFNGKPIFVREYGDSYMEQFGPMRTMRRVRRGANTGFYPGGERANLRSARERFEAYVYQRKNPLLSGACLWAGMDHNRGYETNEGAVGLFDFLRLPKYFAHLFAAQQEIGEGGARCFIANEWTEDSPRDVEVYTNAERVRLYLNGKLVAEKEAGGEKNIHPPVLFGNVPWESGTLRAEALVGGKVVAEHTVKTPQTPKKLLLKPMWAGEEGWTADGSDLLMVHAFVVDENGTVVPDSEPEIKFSVKGDASIVGEKEEWVHANPARAEAGIGGVLLRAGTRAGNVVLTASSPALETATITLKTVPDCKRYLPSKALRPVKRIKYEVDRQELFSVLESERGKELARLDVGANRPASASSCAEGHSAENANKRGEVMEPWVAADRSLPQWWQCDLGETFSLNGVSVLWEKDGMWYDYDVETSLDGKDWTMQCRGHASGQTLSPDRFPEPVSARFVRIVVWSVNGKVPVGILHVEILGKK